MMLRVAGPAPRDPALGSTRVAHLSDIHWGKDRDPVPSEALRVWLPALAAWRPDVLVVSGDLVETPEDHAGFLAVRAELEACGMPWIVVPGNHDIRTPDAPTTFDDVFGATPRVERVKGAELLLFDSFRGLPTHRRTPEELAHATHWAHGAVPASQYAFMNERREGGVGVAVVHHHVLDDLRPKTDGSHKPMLPLYEHDAFLDWCMTHEVRVILHGHKHAPVPPVEARPGVWVFRGSAAYKLGSTARLIDLSDGPPVFHELTLEDGL